MADELFNYLRASPSHPPKRRSASNGEESNRHSWTIPVQATELTELRPFHPSFAKLRRR